MRQLVLDQISRRFGAVQALDAVELTLSSGEIHALMGENGAGKSTLIRILAGLDRPDEGSIRLDDASLQAGSPAVMRSSGLRFIHQETHIVPGLSVAENMHLDQPYPKRAGLVNWRALNAAAAKALSRLGLGHLNPKDPITQLGTGEQMLVRIAATLIGQAGADAWLYVMDEPTAALTNNEAERLFDVIGELKKQGAGILYVSHRMPEVLRLADRVTVLRDGRRVSTCQIGETDFTKIIADMTGRTLDDLFPQRSPSDTAAAPILHVQDLQAPPLVQASFDLHPGEVLGVAGLAGSGRGALLRALLGDAPRWAGRVLLRGAPVGRTPGAAWAQGMAYVPRERRSQGLMLDRSIAENIALPHLRDIGRFGMFLDHKRQRKSASDLGQRVRLKSARTDQACAELSGGNQQKVVFARAVAQDPLVLLLDEPTRGVDIGARYDLYRLIRQLSDEGLGVILASSDLPELLGLSDRIAVMRDGTLAEIVVNDGLSEADLLSRFYHLPQQARTA